MCHFKLVIQIVLSLVDSFDIASRGSDEVSDISPRPRGMSDCIGSRIDEKFQKPQSCYLPDREREAIAENAKYRNGIRRNLRNLNWKIKFE